MEALSGAVGPMAAPFIGLVGLELLPRLQAGEDVQAAVEATPAQPSGAASSGRHPTVSSRPTWTSKTPVSTGRAVRRTS